MNIHIFKLLTMAVLVSFSSSLEARVTIRQADKDRAAALVSQMTLEEKIDLIAGARSFYTHSIPRLGIPEIRMADGPQGVRNNTKSTLYPAGILTASTWNRDLARDLGNSLANDCKARGVRIILGPGVNIYRAAMCGRNFEYFGEDPYLTGETAREYILGVQENGVMATVKHFAANNQEWSRHQVSSDVDERTLHEIYFPAFRKAVEEAGVGAIMDSYNLVNSVHSTENAWMNIDVARCQWGFDGIIMSDWTSVYSTLGALTGGLDLECPTGRYFNRESIIPLIENGVVREAAIDEKVRHILQTFIAFGFLDSPAKDESIPMDNTDSKATALAIAREGIVMLKNDDGTLPVRKNSKILVLGPNADRIPTGGGSGFVTPYSSVSVYSGLKSIHGEKNVSMMPDSVLYKSILPEIFTDKSKSSEGFIAEYYGNENLGGGCARSLVEKTPEHSWGYGAPFSELPADNFSVRWTGNYTPATNGKLRFVIGGDDGYRLFINGKQVGGNWGRHSLNLRTVFYDVISGENYNIRFEFFDGAGEATVKFQAGMFNETGLYDAVKYCSEIVFCGGFDSNTEGEGFDRGRELPAEQRDIIEKVAGKKPLTVVLNAGGGIDFSSWEDKADAILMAWYPGQEGGTAVAEILTGRISPSGKLPISIEKKWDDSPVRNSYYDVKGSKRVTYSEGIFTGYRGFDRNGVRPEYPFGFGLSYTYFEYSDIQLKALGNNMVEVNFDVTNRGKTDASEIAQVYVRDVESSVPRPEKELKGYCKKLIKKGCTEHFTITLDKEAFWFYDIETKKFKVEAGEFEVLVGGSSCDLPLKAGITL